MNSDPFGRPPWETPPEPEPDPQTATGLLALLDNQANLLVAVATGGPRTDATNGKYKHRRRALNAALRGRGLAPPFPYEDLWAWHGHWSQHLSSYASRREHVRELAAPTRAALEAALNGAQVADPGAATTPTWAALDTRLTGVVTELATATTQDDLQDVGRRCREVLIDAAKLLADPGSSAPAPTPRSRAMPRPGWSCSCSPVPPDAVTGNCGRLCPPHGIWPRRSPTATWIASTPTPPRRPPFSSSASCSSSRRDQLIALRAPR